MVHSGLKRSGKLDIVKITGLPVRDFFPDNKRNDNRVRRRPVAITLAGQIDIRCSSSR